MQRIKQGDEVIVLTGRDRGKRGTVLKVLQDGRALVDAVNVVKRHTRPNPNQGQTGGIIEKEAPIQLSNLALWNPATKKADRVGFRLLEDGRKVRYFKSNGEVVDLT
ncbi:MAG: 50S ribosomal protein L24 [Gammaproteobacteria bacterium]|nr:50S ribosomal protein L24 [Gammaproteobacteria bacterium]NIV76025.1 50S ribosomal protein L24 [Gammaproteobacteria bacterium]